MVPPYKEISLFSNYLQIFDTLFQAHCHALAQLLQQASIVAVSHEIMISDAKILFFSVFFMYSYEIDQNF